MNKYRLAGVAVAAVVTTPISAYALNFDFSFTGGGGTIVTGEITGLDSSGKSAANAIFIDSAFANPQHSYPFNFLTIGRVNITENAFTVSNGKIIGAKFFGSYIAGILGPTFVLALNHNGMNAYLSSHVGNTGNSNGFAAITFSQVSAVAAVPEPASIALLGAGLAGISAFRRRRAP